MSKILFNRSSLMVRCLEGIGLINSILFLFEAGKGRSSVAATGIGLYLFLLLCYLFVRACDLIFWYSKEDRGIGIEVHFKKALVPTSYILAITSTMALLNIPYFSSGIIFFADLLMLVVAPVNGILIYFYFRDEDQMSINYFSLNKYLYAKSEKSSF